LPLESGNKHLGNAAASGHYATVLAS
jgi:hypothetical protein